MVPPGIPNTTSTPTASSERTSDCAPVTRTGAPAGGPGLGRGGGAGVGLGACRDVALVITSAVRLIRFRGRYGLLDNKKPPPTGWVVRGSRVRRKLTSSASNALR